MKLFGNCLTCLAMFFATAFLACSGELLANEFPGKKHFYDAIRTKINAESMRDLNKTIDHLQKALDLGLDEQDTPFAELMMSDSLMQRSNALMRVVTDDSIRDKRVQQIVRQVISDLRRVLAYADPPPEAHYTLGKLMVLPGGDKHEARRLLSAYLEFPDQPDARRADAYFQRARVQTEQTRAEDDFARAVELDSENATIRLARAVYLANRKESEDALADVSAVLEKNPQNPNALMIQGKILRETGELQASLESFARASKLAPQSPMPYQQRGEVFRILGNADKALQEFNKVLELQPNQMEAQLHRSEIYLRKGQFEQAMEDVDNVLLQQPKLVLARQIRAEILAFTNRVPEAIDELQRVMDEAPNKIQLRAQLGKLYQFDRQNGKAIEFYTQVLADDPKNADVLRDRGDAYLTQGDHPEAIGDFEAAMKLIPEDITLLNNLAWVLATSPDDALRDGTRAVELATKACELTEYKLPHILSTLAAAFAESGDFNTAIEWSEKAVELDNTEQEEQLSKELASYRGGQPWRERQSLDVETQETANPGEQAILDEPQ